MDRETINDFIHLPKSFVWDLSWRQGRYEVLHAMTRSIPGHVGMRIRRILLKHYIKRAGDLLQINVGVHIRGIHNLSLGDNVHIGANVFINANGGVDIGDDVMIGVGSMIWSANHAYADLSSKISDQGYVDKKVSIGCGVWIGANCFIHPGADIGEGAIVSAGSVLGGKRVERYSIVAGNPARKISSRLDWMQK